MSYSFPQVIIQWFKSSNFWHNNYLILRQFKKFKKIAILALVFSLLAATLEGFSIGFLLSFLQNLTTPNSEPIQTGISWFDTWILATHTSAISRLYRISVLILLTTWSRAFFNYLTQVYTEFSQLCLADCLRKEIFEQLQKLPLSYFAKTRSGDLINTITTEIERIKQWFSGAAFLMTRCMTVFVYFLSMLLLSWHLTIISFFLFILLAVGLSTLNTRARETSFKTSIANGNFTSIAIEFINSIRTVKSFSTEEFERKRFYHASDKVVITGKKVILTWALVKPLAEAIASTILISTIIFAFSTFVINGSLQVASLLTFFFVLFRVVPIIQDINGTRAHLSTLQGTADNIKEVIRTDNKSYLQNGHLQFTGLQHSIDIVSTDFGYDAHTLVLNNITLSIEKGKTTALVGSTGAGKSTLIDLIPRFYDPTGGNILIDGIDIRQFDIRSLRQKIAVVSQDTFIFNTSVRNNIAYGVSGVSDAEIRQVAQLANALEFIEQMPEGLDSQLGDRGVRLSGGQRQRIAIARALLRNPEILILDEATSALDSVTERLIQESLEKLSAGRTVIAIAHRLSTIAQAHKVVILEQGRIVEQGKYQELLEQKGKLWEYHQTQYQIGV